MISPRWKRLCAKSNSLSWCSPNTGLTSPFILFPIEVPMSKLESYWSVLSKKLRTTSRSHKTSYPPPSPNSLFAYLDSMNREGVGIILQLFASGLEAFLGLQTYLKPRLWLLFFSCYSLSVYSVRQPSVLYSRYNLTNPLRTNNSCPFQTSPLGHTTGGLNSFYLSEMPNYVLSTESDNKETQDNSRLKKHFCIRDNKC